MDLKKVMLSKARSCTCLNVDYSYEDIKDAIEKKVKNEYLNTVLKTCKKNPTTTLFVIYRTGADDILVLFGNPVVSLTMTSRSIRDKVDGVEGYTYIWCHSV